MTLCLISIKTEYELGLNFKWKFSTFLQNSSLFLVTMCMIEISQIFIFGTVQLRFFFTLIVFGLVLVKLARGV